MHAYRLDHYQELGIPRDADAEAIRTAYRTRAKALHPDRSGQAGASTSNEPFLRLQEAYAVLRDPLRREQYDLELARQAEMAAAARHAAHTALVPVAARPPPSGPATRFFVTAILLVAVVTAGIGIWQIFFRAKPESALASTAGQDGSFTAPAARSGTGTSEASANRGALKREIDRALQAQVERVEAARKRMEEMEAQLGTAGGSRVGRAPGEAASAAPTMAVARVECIGVGTKIVLSRESDGIKVSYDAKPAVPPRVSDLGGGTVLVSRIEPTSKYALGFTKGDRNDTKLLLFDSAGKVQGTFNVECTAAAF